MTQSTLITRALFGGSMRCLVPSSLEDLSTFRQVPDNQECFYDAVYLLAIEMLERQDISDDDASLFFFNDLAETNESIASEFLSATKAAIRSPSSDLIAYFGCGTQLCRKQMITTASIEEHSIRVDLCVIRLRKQETDLLISLTTTRSDTVQANLSLTSSELLKKIAQSFEIVDWTLFG